MTGVVRHERPMSELELQVRAPLTPVLRDGERVAIERWSLSGFDFPGESDLLPREAELSIPFQGVDIRFPVRLARQGGGRFLAFDGLTGRQRETLAVFYRSLLSGRMAATDDVITSVDAPVDLVPMGKTEADLASVRGIVASKRAILQGRPGDTPADLIDFDARRVTPRSSRGRRR